ncbi:MAG: hypothetical protein ACO1SV_18950 [Fimbriimonas sp.]
MKSLKAVLALVVLACVVAGCNPDKSGATQQMPATASTPNNAPTMPSNLPPQAQKAIQQSAPVGK